MATVAVIMGSKSDTKKVQPAVDILEYFNIPYSWRILSAHRTSKPLENHIQEIDEDPEYKVIIAAAGMSAALPGVIAAQTVKPVIGIPLSGKVLEGMDAVLSMLQMPPGIPVATVGIDAAKNAGLQAVSILAAYDEAVRIKLCEYRKNQADEVLKADRELQESITTLQ